MKTAQRTFAVILIILGLTGFIYLALRSKPQSLSLELGPIWKQDIQNIEKTIPLLHSIKEVEFLYDDEKTKDLFRNLKSPFTLTDAGENKIEILILLQATESPIHVIIQHHITDIKSGNSVYEFARTYQIGPDL